MIYTFIDRACPDLPTSACCRVMKVATSGFYAWRNRPCSDRDLDDSYLTNTIADIHRMSAAPMGHRGYMPSSGRVWATSARVGGSRA